MDFRLQVKTQEFSNFLKEMQASLGRTSTLKRITDMEASKVLEKAIELTGKADILKMQSKVAEMRAIRVDGHWIGLFNRKTGQYHHFSNKVWRGVTSQKRIFLHRLKIAIGLSKQSWWLMALKLGYPVNAPGYVQTALPSRHRESVNPSDNVTVTRHEGTGTYGLELTNNMPKIDVAKVNGRRAIFAAIAGRIGFFKKNMAAGVFKDHQQIAAKYPGVQVTTTGI